MAFKISKTEQKRIDELATTIREGEDDFTNELEIAKDKIAAIVNRLRASAATLQEHRNELGGVIQDIHDERQGEWDDKSERWQEGDNGEAANTWLEHLEDIATRLQEEIEIDEVELVSGEWLTMEGLDEEIQTEPEN